MRIHELTMEKGSVLAQQAAPIPVVVSITRGYRADGHGRPSAEVLDRLSAVLEELAAVVRSGGGFIGHIKAFVTMPDGAMMGLSVVRDKALPQAGLPAPAEPVTDFKLALTAIVYNCEQGELSRLVELALALGLPAPWRTQALTPAPIKMLVRPDQAA